MGQRARTSPGEVAAEQRPVCVDEAKDTVHRQFRKGTPPPGHLDSARLLLVRSPAARHVDDQTASPVRTGHVEDPHRQPGTNPRPIVVCPSKLPPHAT